MTPVENTRTVISVELNDRGRLSVRNQTPNCGPQRATWLRAGLDSFPAVGEPATLRDHGEALYRGLLKHKGVKQRLREVMSAEGDKVYPLYIRTEGPGREQLHWEALFNDRFLALDRRWPIARHVDPGSRTRMSRGFAPPLRMLAFLSALEHSADKEWEALITAVRSARTKGLEIDFCALVGERALLDVLQVRAQEERDYTVHPMPSPSGIEVMLGEIRPQILHFFCHGREAMGTTSVELATLADRAQEAPEPMLLTLDMLKHLPALEELWLVTFNCCQSARGADGLHSLAEGLVQEVAPAAVGWREAAAQHSANQFSRSFYADVLGWLAANLRGADPGEAVRIEWAAHLYSARGALRDQYGGEVASRDWALPVLYAPYGDLLNVHVYKPGGGQSDQEFRQSLFEAGNLQLAIDALPPDAPAQVRAYLEEQLDAARSAASEASVQ